MSKRWRNESLSTIREISRFFIKHHWQSLPSSGSLICNASSTCSLIQGPKSRIRRQWCPFYYQKAPVQEPHTRKDSVPLAEAVRSQYACTTSRMAAMNDSAKTEHQNTREGYKIEFGVLRNGQVCKVLHGKLSLWVRTKRLLVLSSQRGSECDAIGLCVIGDDDCPHWASNESGPEYLVM